MKSSLILTRPTTPIRRSVGFCLVVLAALMAASLLKPGQASSAAPRVAPCVAGANARGFDGGEFLTPTLNAGTKYFIVVDAVNPDPNVGSFHFSLRRGLPANDTCATAAVIDQSRLHF